MAVGKSQRRKVGTGEVPVLARLIDFVEAQVLDQLSTYLQPGNFPLS